MISQIKMLHELLDIRRTRNAIALFIYQTDYTCKDVSYWCHWIWWKLNIISNPPMLNLTASELNQIGNYIAQKLDVPCRTSF